MYTPRAVHDEEADRLVSRLLSTFCIWFGHSRIVRTCLYEVSCARCKDRIGDNLMGTVDLTYRVIVGHGCQECRANWSRLGWRDKLFAPRKQSVLFNRKLVT